MDYNKDAVITKEFFAKVQNKLHYAIHGQSAAYLIVSRANAEKDHMGLSSWEKCPDGKIVKSDVSIAKNYLTETELGSLGRVVNAYLDLAEDRAKGIYPRPWKTGQYGLISFWRPTTVKYCEIVETLRRKSPGSLTKANLRNTVSFKTAYSNRILIKK